MLDDIYSNPLLKYPLTDSERKRIRDVWEFIEVFKGNIMDITNYRSQLISSVRKTYDMKEFYELESIVNKMFWNLRWLLFPLWAFPEMKLDEYYNFILNNYNYYVTIPYSLLLTNKVTFNSYNEMVCTIGSANVKDKNYHRSSINKIIIPNTDLGILLTKDAEGSSDLYAKNYFNILTFTILFERSLYEQIMRNPILIRHMNIHIPEAYYQMDYGFPNLNTMMYDIGSKEDKINRIKKLYFSKYNDSYWFKVIGT